MFWQEIYFKVYPDPLCTSCQIDTSECQATLKWVLMEIIPSTSTKSSTKDTTFANYLLIVDDYSNITKLYGMENINTKEVMD